MAKCEGQRAKGKGRRAEGEEQRASHTCINRWSSEVKATNSWERRAKIDGFRPTSLVPRPFCVLIFCNLGIEFQICIFAR